MKTYYGILSEADSIEIFPTESLRDSVLHWYYDIEFECSKINFKKESVEDLKAWVEKEYEGIYLLFPKPSITYIQLENHELKKRVDEIDKVVGRLEEACGLFVKCFLKD